MKENFKELKIAYKAMCDECNFYFENLTIDHNKDDDETWILTFKCYNVGIRMSMEYEFLMGDDPVFDTIKFYGDPYSCFSIYCYQIITTFIQTLQKYRLDEDIFFDFIDYLGDSINE